MELRAFEKDDYELLISWIDSAKLNYLWGGPKFEFPLDSEQLSQHCSLPEVFPFIFVVSGESAGYVELFKVAEAHFRICRVFVSNDFRGRGISKKMLGQLIDIAREKYNSRVLSLAVFEQNVVAKKCYESLGFSVTSIENSTRCFDGEDWDLLHMERRL